MLLPSVARTARAPVPVASCCGGAGAAREPLYSARRAQVLAELRALAAFRARRGAASPPYRPPSASPTVSGRRGAERRGVGAGQRDPARYLARTLPPPYRPATAPEWLQWPHAGARRLRFAAPKWLQRPRSAERARVAGARADACGPSRSPGAEALEKTEGKDAPEQTWGLQPLPGFDVQPPRHPLATRAPAHARPARLSAPRCAMTRAGGGQDAGGLLGPEGTGGAALHELQPVRWPASSGAVGAIWAPAPAPRSVRTGPGADARARARALPAPAPPGPPCAACRPSLPRPQPHLAPWRAPAVQQRRYPPPPLPPVLTGHASSLLPY